MLKRFIILILVLVSQNTLANQILIPMDHTQTNHLKAYGLAYMLLNGEIDVDWLLNYRGGGFKVAYSKSIENECKLRAVSYEVLSESASAQIVSQISDPNVNMDLIKLHKAAKIAVYSPIKISPSEFENTDAVLLVLKYAEIPFEVIYDEEILKGDLPKYDWLHLHHEDFTGQFGKSLRRTTPADVKAQEAIASRFGFAKVPQMKLAVAKAIKEFCAGGGFLFAMCSGAETFDIALAAEGIDIVDNMDGDGVDPDAQSRLDFEKTFAFQNFKLALDEYEGMTFSDINSSAGGFRSWGEEGAYFSLFDFSAKWDVIPAMLVQNHEHLIREFMGQTFAFSKKTVKPSVLVMGTAASSDRYIYGELGRGQWTFYGGHDPEGRGGGGRRMPTDLNLYPNSPGYRLILNNVLFPSARKKKRKT
ncbi:asparagine synthetase B [Dyadobacter sp. CY351]|uniref:asparagine synthetase B n=1 Tax=Dyadobacter sp. CY351 TaxID=2909337 RepID=UPI001F42C600|nr:asparagine synthetase B [Dyadobacter sp. CY351]MCF2518135.1 asparagine synthetase B [Dyadobacter sp. CY351]